MNILHINSNYLYSELHSKMIKCLDTYNIGGSVFIPMYDIRTSIFSNEKLKEILSRENILVCECFKKWDRLIFSYKQQKIINEAEKKFNIPEFNCIHAYTLFTDGNVAMSLSRKYGIPYVVAVRNTDVNDFFAKMIHLRHRGIEIMRRASKIFFLSKAYRLQVFDKYVPCCYYDEILKKSCVIPNGIDNYWFENIPLNNKINNPSLKDLRLVFAGTLDKNKNIQTILKTKNFLKEKGFHIKLFIAGKIIDKKIHQLVIADKDTEYVGNLSKAELLKLYRNSHIFVMPSIHESFGLVYAEAMSQGLPVIYTQGQGFDGQFPEGEIGYHVDPHSVESISNAIEKAVINYRDLSNNAVSCSHKFEWNKIVSMYYNIYKEI